MPMDFQVRPARTDDAQALADLVNTIIARGGTTAHEQPFTAEAFDHAYLSGPTAICCFAAVDKATGRYEGFQTLRRYAGPPDGYGSIGTFARVDGTQRGVGSALFAATRAEAFRWGLSGINATIRADNIGGLKFYDRMGFIDHSIHRDVPLKDGVLVDRISKRYVLEGGT